MKACLLRVASLLMILCCFSVSGKNNAGVIFFGVDTLLTNKLFGFDFVAQEACTSSSDYPGCHQHFYFQNFGTGTNLTYNLGLWLGYGVTKGKINLDSIQVPPPDSILYLSGGTVDLIRPDSFTSRVGCVYVFKTGTDARPGFGYPLYAKIKILKFIVVNSAAYQIKMVFLWVCNISGSPDIHSSGLDTFHLDTVPTLSQSPRQPTNSICRFAGNQHVFKAVGDRFVVPEEFAGQGLFLSVYDVNGRKQESIEVGNKTFIDLRRHGKRQGVSIVRFEKQ